MKKVIQISDFQYYAPLDIRWNLGGVYVDGADGEPYWFVVDLEDYALSAGQLLLIELRDKGVLPGKRWYLSKIL